MHFDKDLYDKITKLCKDIRSLKEKVVPAAGQTKATYKNDGSPQTALEIEIEKSIFSFINKYFPGVPAYGEESGYGKNLSGSYWLVDPIDGTKSFIKGVPAYTAMLVLFEDEAPQLSIIYDYASDDMYVAYRGGGAYKNDELLDLRMQPLASTALCRERLVTDIQTLLDSSGYDLRCESGPSGAGNGFSKVAKGDIAARFNFPYTPGGGHVHDYAPGALLVEEAHGVIIPLDTDSEDYTLDSKSFVACHPDLEATVREMKITLRSLELST